MHMPKYQYLVYTYTTKLNSAFRVFWLASSEVNNYLPVPINLKLIKVHYLRAVASVWIRRISLADKFIFMAFMIKLIFFHLLPGDAAQ